jgi:hypothetical protein
MPAALIRPTLPETNGEPLEDPSEGDGQGRGEPISSKPRSRRRPKPATSGESHGRKLTMPDALFDRLTLYAIRKRMTVSAAAAEVLDRNLPHLRIAVDE